MTDSVRYELEKEVAVVRLDDGKANALSHEVIAALDAAMDRAAGEARSLLILGRPGKLSAGFDLSVMGAGPESARDLVKAGAEMLLKLFTLPVPTVVGCTGHALAAGGIMLLSADVRIGARGPFKIGLNEVAIGMTLPIFGIELARDRLSKRHFYAAVNRSHIYDADTAVDAGFLDRATDVDSLEAEAQAEAQALAQLSTGAYGGTKRDARSHVVETIRATLDANLALITGPQS